MLNSQTKTCVLVADISEQSKPPECQFSYADVKQELHSVLRCYPM